MALITSVGGGVNNFFFLKCGTYLRVRRLVGGDAYLSKYSILTRSCHHFHWTMFLSHLFDLLCPILTNLVF